MRAPAGSGDGRLICRRRIAGLMAGGGGGGGNAMEIGGNRPSKCDADGLRVGGAMGGWEGGGADQSQATQSNRTDSMSII